jgi:hypothetical protein
VRYPEAKDVLQAVTEWLQFGCDGIIAYLTAQDCSSIVSNVKAKIEAALYWTV